jgi:hypothetical protein
MRLLFKGERVLGYDYNDKPLEQPIALIIRGDQVFYSLADAREFVSELVQAIAAVEDEAL